MEPTNGPYEYPLVLFLDSLSLLLGNCKTDMHVMGLLINTQGTRRAKIVCKEGNDGFEGMDGNKLVPVSWICECPIL